METILNITSLGIALFALGWNVYKDIIQKPRIKISFGVYDTVSVPNIELQKTMILFNGVNLGPSDIVIKNIMLKYKKREKPYAIVLPNMEWKKLPQKVSVGDEIQVVTDYFIDCFLATDFFKAGLIDSYGRYHWVSPKNVQEAKERYKIDLVNHEVGPLQI